MFFKGEINCTFPYSEVLVSPCVYPGMCLVSIPEEPMFKTKRASSLHKEDKFTVSIDNLCLRYANKKESPL